MKKKIAFILSLVIFASALTPLYMAFERSDEHKKIVEFCNNVKSLNDKYNTLDELDLKDENGKNAFSQYESRLIIMGNNVSQANEIERISGAGYTILQYESRDIMNSDYESLKSKGYTVQKDNILYCNEIKATSINSYNSSDAGASYIKRFIQESGRSYGDITVGVIDTGIYYYHEIYNGRYIENDVNFSSSGNQNDVLDDYGHGTAVSSVVIRTTPDNVKVKGYKVLDNRGSATTSQVLSVIEYIINEEDKPDIVNMSLGGYELSGDDNIIMNDALCRLVQSGTVVCAAAGNEFVPAEYGNIGGCDDIITVASHDNNGNFSSFSDYGSAVDITAPGENIYCAVYNTTNEYTSRDMTGTSLACPFVSAAVAYIKMQSPDLNPYQIKERLIESAVDVSNDDRHYFGNGILSFINLIEIENKAVISPDKASGEYEGRELTVSFDVPDGSELYYSFNRGILTNIYNEPIVIYENSTLTYALVKDGEIVSDIKSQSYELNYTLQASDITITLGIIKEIKLEDEFINIIIPNGIGGKRPTSVYASTFMNKRFAKITLPDTVTTLGTECFSGAYLTKITAKGVTTLSGNKVFYGCRYLVTADMPKLESVTESAFDGCTCLNYINFGENISKLKSRLFAGTSIINCNLPNAEYPTGSCTEVFDNARIFTCNLPKIDTLNEKIFYNCAYLYQLYTKKVKTIYPKALYGCTFINEMDLSELTSLYEDAMSGIWIKHFYAPKITSIKKSLTEKTTSLGGHKCRCDIIELPELSGELGEKSLYYTSVRTIILPKITKIASDKSIYNAPALKIVYLPKVTEYYSPAFTNASTLDSLFGSDVYCRYSMPELVFIPEATQAGNLIYKELGTIYAPLLTSISIKITEPSVKGNIILSDAVSDNGVTVDCENEALAPNVIAPNNKILNGNFSYVTVRSWKFIGYEDGILTYECNGAESRIPLEYVNEYWSIEMINKSSDRMHSLFFDLQSDGIINAKDFAIYNKLTKNDRIS